MDRPQGRDRVVSVHAYSRRAVGADVARAAVGVACTTAPLALVRPPAGLQAVLVGVAVLFVAYGAGAFLRRATRITVTETGIESEGWRRRAIAWGDVTGLSLAYYSTRRGSGEGWMQLRLKGPGGTLRVESTLDAFVAVVRRAAQAAFDNRLALDRATLVNLRALGIEALTEDRHD